MQESKAKFENNSFFYLNLSVSYRKYEDPVKVMDMQTSPLPSNRAVSMFWSKLLRNVLKRMKNQFFDFCDLHSLRYNP